MGGCCTLARFVAAKGSVTLDGVSLTVNEVAGDTFTVLIIPHTLKVTNSMLDLISDPEHHSRGRTQTDLVNGTHNVEPFLRIAFCRDTLANLIVKDLAAAAWK